jgi:hypothetical protein
MQVTHQCYQPLHFTEVYMQFTTLHNSEPSQELKGVTEKKIGMFCLEYTIHVFESNALWYD